ncbi:CCA tRNA nucleotidyltransferase [Protaetiibacter larvae]|uniref:CCA tRNA nucleotidyltransferase n=1 Tax=Protaetiibacter larvae TaxID=2592654 RepID=A0A5C1Y7X7_9MICO|nr:CCA tRNA nucleotidyltransferase [Protaetiibacter larvae]QEO09032.1 CCA tRNA nucleotidyltransferase [Protaetiibacter larvae]
MQPVAAAVERLHALADSPTVRRIAERFAAAGHELALVGGPVRDAFLGRDAHDLDFASSASPDEILAVIAPLASAHWDIGRAFGTIGARLGELTVEITTYRSDVYDGATRKPVVAFGDSLEGDLLRRDFTVNALALRLPGKVLVDPSGGLEDLLAGRLRTPIEPEVSFGDDPLRMLRGARFTAQLGFTLGAATASAIQAMADRIDIVSAERVGEELTKLLLAPDPDSGLRVLVDTGLAERILPELPALRLEIDEHAHHKDVYEHSLTALRQAIALEGSRGHAPDLVLRLATLLHDIGKPATRRIEPGGAVSFHHHDVLGAKLATKRLRELRFDGETIKAVATLVRLHLRFFGYADAGWTDAAVRRYVRDAGDQLERLHILSRADVTTRNQRKAARLQQAYDELEERIAALAAEEELAAIRPDLDGEQIMAILGIAPGPEVGEAYRHLLELRLDEGPLAPADAEQRLRAWWSARQDPAG